MYGMKLQFLLAIYGLHASEQNVFLLCADWKCCNRMLFRWVVCTGFRRASNVVIKVTSRNRNVLKNYIKDFFFLGNSIVLDLRQGAECPSGLTRVTYGV